MYILTLCHVKSSAATTPPEKSVWKQTSRIAAEKTTAPITTAAAKELAATTGTVPDSKSRNIPEVVVVRRGAVGVLGIWKGWDSWVKGGANGVSLQAT